MTSPVEQVTIRCPACGTVYEDWYRASINADLDPKLAADDDYLEAAATATCPHCGQTVQIAEVMIARSGFPTGDLAACFIHPVWPEGEFNLEAVDGDEPFQIGPFTKDGWSVNEDGSLWWSNGYAHPTTLRVRAQHGVSSRLTTAAFA